MNDTLQIILDAIKENQFSAGLDVIEKVDTFYNNAWSKLILFGSILFGVVGIFIPLIIQWYQKRTLKLSEESLKRELKIDIGKDVIKVITDRFEANENKLKMLNASANSKILFAQAKFSIEKNSYKGALAELISAADNSLECNDYKTIQEILLTTVNNCIPYLSQEEIIDLKTAEICDLNHFLEKLSSKDDRGMFHARIGEIKVTLSKLPRTIQEKAKEKPKSGSTATYRE